MIICITENFLAFLDMTNTEDNISELKVQEVLQNKRRAIIKELSRRIRRQELNQLNHYHREAQVYSLHQMLRAFYNWEFSSKKEGGSTTISSTERSKRDES